MTDMAHDSRAHGRKSLSVFEKNARLRAVAAHARETVECRTPSNNDASQQTGYDVAAEEIDVDEDLDLEDTLSLLDIENLCQIRAESNKELT